MIINSGADRAILGEKTKETKKSAEEETPGKGRKPSYDYRKDNRKELWTHKRYDS